MTNKPPALSVVRRRADKARRRAAFLRGCSIPSDGSSDWLAFDDPSADALVALAPLDRFYDPSGFEGG